MKNKKMAVATAVLAVLGSAGAAFAQWGMPVVNIDPHRHGNLAAAQSSIVYAWQRINEAQQDNNYRLGGHAGRAKELLVEANEELRLAADAANQNER